MRPIARRPAAHATRSALVIALLVLANGCGIGRVGRLFLAELAFVSIVTAASHYDGSLDRPAEGVSDQLFVCRTDRGNVVRLYALGEQTAVARCQHDEQATCECRSRLARRASREASRGEIGFEDEPWPTTPVDPADPEDAADLAAPEPGVAPSGDAEP